MISTSSPTLATPPERPSRKPVAAITLVAALSFLAPTMGVSAEQSFHDGAVDDQAKRFLPETFSTEMQEYGLTFSPDGNVAYFTRGDGIYWSYRTQDGWAKPMEAAFSRGRWLTGRFPDGSEIIPFNWDPVISPDGSRMFIMSHGLQDDRIVEGEDGDIDLWMLRRTGAAYRDTDWSDPVNLGPSINTTEYSEGAAGVSANNTLYFFSTGRSDSKGRADIYVSEYEDGRYMPAQNMGDPVNTTHWDGHTYVDPAGQFMLYIIVGDPDGYGSCDLYVSFRAGPAWGEPRNLGPKVNTEHCELTPSLSPDGTDLYFGRFVGPDGDGTDRDIFTIPLSDTDFPGAR